MAAEHSDLGPDLALGTAWDSLKQNVPFAGHVNGKPVLLVRQGEAVFAVGAKCTHYGAPLSQGLVVDGSIRCPWHHACFRLKDGRAQRGPALAPLVHYVVKKDANTLTVQQAKAENHGKKPFIGPKSVGIVGGGAAGFAALCTLRQEGYTGPITMWTREPHKPYDRIKLSKGYLAGSIHDEALSLVPKPEHFDHAVTYELGANVVGLDATLKHVRLADGSLKPFDTLILAMGAAPKRLPIAGADLPHVCVLRTLEDARTIRQKAAASKYAVVIGASFIGLEAACALRQQNIATTVISPDAMPMGRVLGPELSAYITDLHKEHGAVFEMNKEVTAITQTHVLFADGSKLQSDLVIMAVGVAPDVSWAKQAGLATDSGILVDPNMKTSMQNIYAVGDIAQVRSKGDSIGTRIEHWAVAERLGQRAARSILGESQAAEAAPFFWSDHYDLKLRYVGHAPSVDSTQVYGSLKARKAAVALLTKGDITAVVTIGNDPLSLACEAALEAGDTKRLKTLLAQA